MADGSSGLSLSEMGISTVKKTQKVVQQFAQGAAQQITGQQPAGQNQVPQSGEFIPQAPAGSQLPTADMPDEAGPGNTVHDLFSASSHAAGSSNSSQGGTLFTSPAAQPPDETAPKSGSFDLGSIFGEKNPFESKPPKATTQPMPDFSGQKAEEQKQIEALRQKLFSEYKEDFLAKAEGKDNKKEETVQERLERQDKEEEEKNQKEEAKDAQMEAIDMSGSGASKMPGLFKKQKRKSIFDVLRKPKQGSKEGKLGKG